MNAEKGEHRAILQGLNLQVVSKTRSARALKERCLVRFDERTEGDCVPDNL